MMVINGFVRILIILFLEIMSFDRFNAYTQRCYEVADMTICYFQPSTMTMTWEDAWTVCRENNATLPVIESRLIEDRFKGYVNVYHSLHGYHLWLAGRDFRTDKWQWLNGRPVDERSIVVQGQGYTDQYHTNVVLYTVELFQYRTHDPGHKNYYICRYTDSKLCLNKTTIPWRHGCLVVNNDVTFNLVDARNRCLDEGGDLATFEEEESLHALEMTNSSLLQRNKEYWIGLRRNWWIWNQTGFESSKEIKYSNWFSYVNHESQQCLLISTHDYKWKQESCSTVKRFLCQTVSWPTTTPTQTTDDADKGSTDALVLPTGANQSSDLLVFLVAGVAVLLLTVLLVVVIVVVVAKKRKAKQLNGGLTREQTEGFYQNLHHGQFDQGSSGHYMGLVGVTRQQTEANSDYQTISDYAEVGATNAPDYISIIQ